MHSVMKNRSPNQLIGLVFGAVYIVVGLAGFAVTSGVGFAASEGRNLLLFQLNPLHNVIHLLVGAVLVGFSRRPESSRLMNGLVGATYLVVGVAGLFVASSGGSSEPLAGVFPQFLGSSGNALNILALNAADNALHFLSAAVLLSVALLPALNRDRTHGQAQSEESDESTGIDASHEPAPIEVEPVEVSAKSKTAKPDPAEVPDDRVSTDPDAFIAGDKPGLGVYKCSCGKFGVFMKAGVELPECPVGSGHTYKLSKKSRTAA